jgi:hypothetical protein
MVFSPPTYTLRHPLSSRAADARDVARFNIVTHRGATSSALTVL